MEVIKMNRKVVVLILILLVMPTLTISLVHADTGKGTTKLYFEANYVASRARLDEIRTAPPNSSSPNVQFLTLTQSKPQLLTFQIGSDIYYPNWAGKATSKDILHQSLTLYKIEATVTFDGVNGTIELSITLRSHNLFMPNQVDNGTVVGHGTGYFEGVKILAEYTNPDPANTSHKVLIGTIMGWPGLP